MALVMPGGHSAWLTPISRGRVSHSDSGLNTVGGVLSCPWFVNDWLPLRTMPLSLPLHAFFLENIGHFGMLGDRRSFLAVLDGVTDGAEVLPAGLDEFLGTLHERADVIQAGGRILYFGGDLVQFGDRLCVIEFLF